MGKFVAEQTMKRLGQLGRPVKEMKVVVLGLTFKENVPDLRNSKVPDIIRELQQYGVEVIVHDPMAESAEAVHEYGLQLVEWKHVKDVDCLVLAVAHRVFLEMPVAELLKPLRTSKNGVLIDVKGVLDPATLPASLTFWRL